VRTISWRAQLWFIVLGYAAVVTVAAALLSARYLQEIAYPAEASGGMWAGGDLLLGIFIVCLFMIPTVFLVRVMAKFEGVYMGYSRFLLGLSLSAPVCLSLFYFGRSHLAESVRNLCLYRLFWSPFILAGIGVSRFLARFDRAKRLASYALLIEGLTLGIAIALLIYRVNVGG